jgi:hypothetical protein
MIYTVSKKNYLILVVLISILFLYWCNQKITTNTDKQLENNKNLKNIATGINKKIEDKSDSDIKSGKKINIDVKIEEDKLYENKKEWFSLELSTWRKIQEDINWLLVLISSPQKKWDKTKENLSINTDSQSGKQTIEEYYTQQKKGIQNHIKDFKEISKEEYKIVKENWIKVIYKWILGVNKLQWQQIIFYKNWKIFLITYTATQSTFNEYIDQVNDIIKSLKF